MAGASLIASNETASALGVSTLSFGLTLHQALARDPKWAARNVVISPFGLSAAFGMIYAGARGETAREIAATLGYNLDEPELRTRWSRLHAALDPPTAGSKRGPVEFILANSLWMQTGFQLAPSFRAVVADGYGGAIESIDFARAPEQARDRINGWVKERTRGLIEELFARGSLPSATPLVVVNTAYLRGAWEEPFPRAETGTEPFEMLDGRRVDVPTMHRVSNTGYIKTSDYEAIELRYAGDRLSMVVILPVPGQFENVEQQLNAAALAALVEALPRAQRRIHLGLPRLATSKPFSLAPVLVQLGMQRAFRAGAEFDGMVASSATALFLGQVRHQIHLSMDEEQTEAAAATGVVISYGAAAEMVRVRIDRPFLLGIHDRKTGALLFWGRIVDPRPER
jgi:serpin B